MEWLCDLEAFLGVRYEWDSLYEASRTTNVFLTHAWLAHWLGCFGDGRQMMGLSRCDRGLVAAVAFVRVGRMLRFLEEHTYLSQMLLPQGGSPTQLLAELAREHRNHVELFGPRDPRFRERVVLGAYPHFVVVEKHPHVTRSIAVSSLERYLESRPKKVRSEMRRKLRRFDRELPGCSLSALSCSSAWEHVEAVESRSWKRDSGTAIVCSRAERRFYRGLFELHDAPFETRLYALVRQGEALAYVLAVLHRGQLFALKTSY